MDAKAPMMLAGNYKPGFRINLHIKDLTNALNAAHAINMPVPMTAQMMEVMQELANHDESMNDHSDIVKYYERISGTSIVKEDK
ncbi:2-hydroxy-3-oxopropionate reductase [Lachnospiraceae bacterium TWA4]|nr:2-hydroxy-3-oxopropionate reductase [Lachnospiraceae bacterium TWA4]